jgi:adenylate cyclase
MKPQFGDDVVQADDGRLVKFIGDAVKLAARLVAAAAPGQILASSDVRDEPVDWPAIPQDPLILKGFDSPVAAYDLHLSR